MNGEDVDLGAIFYAMRELAQRSLSTLVPVFLAIAGTNFVLQYFLASVPGLQILGSIISFVLSYVLVKGLARHAGLLEEGQDGPGFGAYFGVSFVMGIGLTLGFLLLIIPGVVLTVRWLLAFPILFSPDDYNSSRGAISQSWDMTRPVFWKLLAAYILGLILVVVSLGAAVQLGSALDPTMVLVLTLVGTVASAAASVYNLVLGFAAFLTLRVNRDELATVFA